MVIINLTSFQFSKQINMFLKYCYLNKALCELFISNIHLMQANYVAALSDDCVHGDVVTDFLINVEFAADVP